MSVKAKLVRFIQIAFALGSLAVFGWAAYVTAHYLRTAPRFEVRELSVSGVDGPLRRMTDSDVIAQAEFEVGTNVFRVNLPDIRERIERLPWVRHAIVQRVLPDQILIKVVEREPIGLARIHGELFQFDADAVILELDALSTASFPILDGLRRDDRPGNITKVAAYRKVIEELGETELSEIHINDTQDVSVVSASDPMLVNLGTSDFRARWIKYLQLKTQIHEQYPQAVKVDLRFKNQVIVRMKDDDNGEQVVWDGERKIL